MLKWLLLLPLFAVACTSVPDLSPKIKTVRPLAIEKKYSVSAASAIVLYNAEAYVVADDERFLYSFDLPNGPGQKYPITKTDYPEEGRERSKVKADYEAMIQLKVGNEDHFLVLPSGSKPTRMRGALIGMNKKTVQAVNFAPLFEHLTTLIPELNIEGIVEWKDFVILFQRGNGPAGQNAMIYLTKAALMLELKGQEKGRPSALEVSAKSFVRVQNIDLGKVDGTKLAFSDARYMEGVGIYFLASAEAHSTPQANGKVLGTQLGLISDATGKVEKIGWFPKEKLEGLDMINDPEDGWQFYFVNDPDDRKQTSQLTQFTL